MQRIQRAQGGAQNAKRRAQAQLQEIEIIQKTSPPKIIKNGALSAADQRRNEGKTQAPRRRS